MTNALRLGLRHSDSLGRYGGEEFIALLPATDMSAAMSLAERLRKMVEQMPLDCDEPAYTVAIGLTWYKAVETRQRPFCYAPIARSTRRRMQGATRWPSLSDLRWPGKYLVPKEAYISSKGVKTPQRRSGC